MLASSLIPRALILIAFAVVLGVPWFFRPVEAVAPAGAERLVILTPHNEPIRHEFARAFDRWHRREHGKPVVIDWRVPGGTSEIKKVVVAQYTAAVESGRITPGGDLAPGAQPMPYDLFFGGGSFEHNELKTKGPTIRPPGADREIMVPITVPLGYTSERLDEWYGPGEPMIGINPLYDPEQYWLGNAVSGFGIVFNRDVLRELSLPDPKTWTDLADPRYTGRLALADPRQSGSVATTYESILYSYGWEEGWRLLRSMSGNSRYFSNTSQKVPLDVSLGQAAAGTAIDFYGRYQSQSIMKPGETPETARIGYIDPPGEVLIDPDPISLMRAGPNPIVARRFIEFVLSEEGQALWNFPKRSTAEPDALGPEKFELRRLPIRRIMYEKHMDRHIDRVDPYLVASRAENKGWRSAIGVMMGAFAIDIHTEQVRAWRAIERARDAGAPDDLLAAMEARFFSWPVHIMADGSQRPFNESNYRAIRADWREAERDGRMNRIRLAYTAFFRDQYATIVEMADERRISHPPVLTDPVQP